MARCAPRTLWLETIHKCVRGVGRREGGSEGFRSRMGDRVIEFESLVPDFPKMGIFADKQESVAHSKTLIFASIECISWLAGAGLFVSLPRGTGKTAWARNREVD